MSTVLGVVGEVEMAAGMLLQQLPPSDDARVYARVLGLTLWPLVGCKTRVVGRALQYDPSKPRAVWQREVLRESARQALLLHGSDASELDIDRVVSRLGRTALLNMSLQQVVPAVAVLLELLQQLAAAG